MPKPESFDEWFARWKKMMDGLLGNVEEITHEEAKEILATSQIDSRQLGEQLHARLSTYATSLRLQGRPVPDQILEALEALRPETAPPRDIAELKHQAERWIDKLSRHTAETLSPPRLAFSYRNKKELFPEDKEVLDKLAKKVEEKIRGK